MKLTYSLTPVSSEFTGGAKVYRAVVQANGIIDRDTFAAAIAEKTKQDKSLALYFLSSIDDMLNEYVVNGYRVNLGQLTTGFALRGPFTSEDDRFDPTRHTLVPTIRALDPLKSALNAVGAENVTVGLSCSVYALMDSVTHEFGCITGTNAVHIEGKNIGIDTDNADEGVTLVNPDTGVVAATATVTSSDTSLIVCSFPTPPTAGVYTLVVSCRNGNRESLAPAVGKLKNIVVKAA